MPLPAPMDDEERGDFLRRCMADPVMVSEFDDEAQRMAVCIGQWQQKS